MLRSAPNIGFLQRALAFLLVVFLLPVSARSALPEARVAVVGPMSGSSFSIGIQFNAGVMAAVQTLTDGTILGHQIVLSTHDDQCRKNIAEKLAKNIVNNTSPVLIIGHSCSAAAIAGAPIYAKGGILQISPTATSPRLTELGISNLFRMIGRDDQQGEIAADRIAMQYPDKQVAVLHYTGGYSRTLASVAVDRLKRKGITPVTIIESEPGAYSYVEEAEQLIKANIDLLYVVGGGLDTGILVRQLRMLGAEFDIMGTDTLISRVFPDAAPNAAGQVVFTAPTIASFNPTYQPAYEVMRDMDMDPFGYTALAYAATEVWLEGVKRAGGFDAISVAAAIRREPIDTIIGVVEFDEKGDITTTYPPFSWYRWQAGQRVVVD